VKRTKGIAAGAVSVADLAPVPPSPGTAHTEPLIKMCING
jgi:hypothetical protein